jgi:hypothetical protein
MAATASPTQSAFSISKPITDNPVRARPQWRGFSRAADINNLLVTDMEMFLKIPTAKAPAAPRTSPFPQRRCHGRSTAVPK